METAIKAHPNDQLGLDMNGPRTADPSFKAPPIDQYGVMKCINLATGQFLGYLGTAYNQYVDIVEDVKQAARLKWYGHNSDLYLDRQTDPNDRYLGVGYHSYACYGLWVPNGWVDAVLYNADKTISLKSDPKRKLYKYGDNYVCWSDGESNQNILSFELALS